MAHRIKVELIPEGVEALFKDPAIQDACYDAAATVARAAGKGFAPTRMTKGARGGAAVWSTTWAAYKNRNQLLKALGSAVPADKIRSVSSGAEETEER